MGLAAAAAAGIVDKADHLIQNSTYHISAGFVESINGNNCKSHYTTICAYLAPTDQRRACLVQSEHS